MTETTALITPVGTAAWPKLFVAALPHNAKADDKPKFTMALLFDEAGMASPEMATLQAAVMDCGVAKWGEAKFRVMLEEGAVKLPFLKDIATKGYPPHIKRYINIASGENYPPAVVDRSSNAIKDTRAIISGTQVRASVSVRAYGGPGVTAKNGSPVSPGIQIDMRNVQKVNEGTPLSIGGSGDAKADFGSAPLPAVVEPPIAAMPGGKSLAEMMG